MSSHAGKHLDPRKGFGDVVDTPCFEPQHLGSNVFIGRYENDRRVGRTGISFNISADGKTIHVGQMNVQEHQVRAESPGQLHGLLPVGGTRGLEPNLTENAHQHLRRDRVVVHD